MSEISVWPDEVAVPFGDEVNLLEALTEAGVPIAHLCGGKARCSTCRVRILDGLGDLSGRTDKEVAMADRLGFPDEIRLACQTTAFGSVRLGRLVLDKVDEALASQIGKPRLVGPVGKEVNAAVMFTDVVGYTEMADSLPAYDIVHLLNRFFSRVSAEVDSRIPGRLTTTWATPSSHCSGSTASQPRRSRLFEPVLECWTWLENSPNTSKAFTD